MKYLQQQHIVKTIIFCSITEKNFFFSVIFMILNLINNATIAFVLSSKVDVLVANFSFCATCACKYVYMWLL